jgi:hypothetical protein
VPTLGQLEAERAQSPRSDAAQAEFERGDHDASLSPGDVLAILAHNMNQAMTDPQYRARMTGLINGWAGAVQRSPSSWPSSVEVECRSAAELRQPPGCQS